MLISCATSQALGRKQIRLTEIPEWLSRHLLPMPPVCFNYTVKLDGESPTLPDCYDLDCQVRPACGLHTGAGFKHSSSGLIPLLCACWRCMWWCSDSR
jgi:hypothetical protein